MAENTTPKKLPMKITLDEDTLKIWIKSFIYDMYPDHIIEDLTMDGIWTEGEYALRIKFTLEKDSNENNQTQN